MAALCLLAIFLFAWLPCPSGASSNGFRRAEASINRYISPHACYPSIYRSLQPIPEGSGLEAHHARVTGTVTAKSGALVDDSSTSGEESVTRRLGKHAGPVYVPAKAELCEQCTTCKQLFKENPSVSPSTSCKKACKKCPFDVVLGAESAISIEVDGITAIEYVRDESAGGQGRALQASNDLGNGIIVKQYATTVFEGRARGVC